MKYRQICSLLGTAGVLSNSFSYDAQAIKLQQNHINGQQLVQLDTDDQLEMEEEDGAVEVSNIYGIPSKEEKSQMLAQKAKKAKNTALEGKKKTLKENFDKFSKSLSEEDFDSSVKMKNDLIENDGQPADALDKIKINTVETYKHQFSFPEVAKNDFSTALFEELEISQKNLNSNLDNVDLFNNFVETADKVKKALKEKYADQWTDPVDGAVPSEDQADD